MRILLTGGSGLLGAELRRLDTSLIAPSPQRLDVTQLESVRSGLLQARPDMVLHLAAATNPPAHEEDPVLGLTVNIIGTAHVALACYEARVRLVYTSTDHIYVGAGPHQEEEPIWSPYKFGWSKMGGESAVRMLDNSLILRLSFGPVPYPWEKVYDRQYTSKLYVDEMAPLVLAAARSTARGVMNLGGKRQRLRDYARRSRPEIETVARPKWVPGDTSLDVTRMQEELDIKDLSSLWKRT